MTKDDGDQIDPTADESADEKSRKWRKQPDFDPPKHRGGTGIGMLGGAAAGGVIGGLLGGPAGAAIGGTAGAASGGVTGHNAAEIAKPEKDEPIARRPAKKDDAERSTDGTER
jgi:uncharacterized protein YcfJ